MISKEIKRVERVEILGDESISSKMKQSIKMVSDIVSRMTAGG
jgi:hypothetical protein